MIFSTKISAFGAIVITTSLNFLERKRVKITICELTGMLSEGLNQAKTDDMGIKTEAHLPVFLMSLKVRIQFF